MGVGVGQRLVHGLGEPLDQVGVVLQELLGGEVDGHGEVGGGVDVVRGDQAAALGEGGRQERLHHPDRVHPASLQRRRHVGEGSSVNLLDDDLLAGQVGGRLDRGSRATTPL